MRGRYIAALLVSSSIACSGGGGGAGGAGGSHPGATGTPGTTSTQPTPPPVPATTHPPCVLNADCPAGEHCDLAECVQSCNTQMPCDAGLTCSPRGQCLASGQASEPAPATQYAGSLTASPATVQLTDRSTSLDVQLTSTSKSSVRFRLGELPPYLSAAKTSGEFTGTTTLHFSVNPAGLQGHDVGGVLKLFSSIGDVSISAPIHVGMTGTYSGAMRYTAGNVPLGDTRLALDVLQDLTGEVSVRMQSQASLLFPATDVGDVTGHGQYSTSGGLHFTLVQIVDPTFGADRNHFGRSIGRSIEFRLTPDGSGNLSGTFHESIVGLFAEPVTVGGTVSLQYQPTTNDPNFSVGTVPSLPTWPSGLSVLSPKDIFGWTDSPDCGGVISEMGAASSADKAYGAPLQQAFASRGDNPIQDYATICASAQKIVSLQGWQHAGLTPAPNGQSCGLVVPLACALTTYASQSATSDSASATAASQLVSDVLAPALLLAENDNVSALTSSFTQGTSAQLAQYNNAMTALAPAASWVLQPVVLEYMRNIPAQAAEGSTTSGSPTFPAARALATLFYVSGVIDGERARIDAAAASGSQPQLAAEAQQRAVLGFLEAMSLLGIAQQWGIVPDSVTSHLSGMLTPLDNGFAALVQGANAFGVPPSFVPFLYSAANAGSGGATNFEQMRTIAMNSVSAETNLETQFLADQRAYESNLTQLQQELANVRSQYDFQIQSICGVAFDPNAVTDPSAWKNCGANQQGSVGALLVQVQQAQAKVQADLSGLQAQKDKIQIDVSALAQTQQLAEQQVQFISSTGESLGELDFASGMLTAAEQSIQIAANSQVLNFGAPFAEATAALVIGAIQAGIAQDKQQLETAQSMEAVQVSAAESYVNGMAAIQKETIDLQQMGIAMTQDQLQVVFEQVQAANQVAQAKGLFAERQQVLAAIASPTDLLADPSYRLLTDQLGLQIVAARAQAQQQLFLAGSALQYEINQSLNINGAVLNASNSTGLNALSSCLENIYNGSRIAYGTPQVYPTTVSIRKMLGISGPRTDAVTGATLSEADQFRELLLRNSNFDNSGGVGIPFSTDLQPDNGLWGADVCDDRIVDVQAQLVGDFLGDNEAQVNLSLTGTSVVRACDGPNDLVTWTFGTNGSAGSAFAVIGAGVNTFGTGAPNTSLFGQSVARASWRIVVPGPQEAPSNSDVDFTHIDDIVLKIDHQALPLRSSPVSIDTSCLAQIGGGQ